ncbi:hypothetical protein EJ06DRAFT_363043 [Trichodelitschia bisporula]|uniref:Uncharacterized protein n=1 Tax=Trichodelitschia bisporula TaxID=703511 RepID=A0A6G1I189_9PEZI|nr:hypothetical protein EJ06DRAFT_363043 [Trichodelitschia bisporula]
MAPSRRCRYNLVVVWADALLRSLPPMIACYPEPSTANFCDTAAKRKAVSEQLRIPISSTGQVPSIKSPTGTLLSFNGPALAGPQQAMVPDLLLFASLVLEFAFLFRCLRLL